MAKAQDPSALHNESIVEGAVVIGRGNDGWEFRVGDDIVRSPQVVSWGSWKGICKQSGVWLSDGSWICGDVSLSSAGVEITSDWLNCPPIPLQRVRGVVLTPAASLSGWSQLQNQLQQADGNQDFVWLNSSQTLSGIVDWNATGKEMFRLETGGKQIPITEEEVRAIVFSPALVGRIAEKSLGLSIGLKDGSLLRTRDVQSSRENLEITLLNRLKLSTLDDDSSFAAAICYLAETPNDYVFLSDLEPASYRHLSDLSLKWKLGINKDVIDRPLTLQNGIVDKGLAMHSSSQAAYRWDGKAGTFLAEIVLAEPFQGADRRLGSVTCRVLLAQDGKLETAAEVQMHRSSPDAPSRTIQVDVTGAQLVVLVTEEADMGQSGDHVLWLSPRISKP